MATAGTMPVVMPPPMRDDEAVLAGLGWAGHGPLGLIAHLYCSD